MVVIAAIVNMFTGTYPKDIFSPALPGVGVRNRRMSTARYFSNIRLISPVMASNSFRTAPPIMGSNRPMMPPIFMVNATSKLACFSPRALTV